LSAATPIRAPRGPSAEGRSGAFILSNLAIGHAITHWYNQSLLVILPFIRDSMSLTNIEFAALATIRQVSSGVANVPAGFAIDMAKRQWGVILTACMVVAAISFTLVAFSPNYSVLAVVMVLVALPGTVWHMPAIAAISQRFPDRRGFGLSIHGAGGNVGNFIGPLVAGVLLGVMVWQKVALLYVIPALVVAVVVWWSLRDIGTSGVAPNESKPLGDRVRQAVGLLRQRAILSLLLVTMLRNMGFTSLLVWVPVYLIDPVEKGGLGMSGFMVGLHTAFLTGLGVASSPVLGYLSDRFGRKVVVVPGLLITALLTAVMGLVGAGLLLTLVILVVGLFTYALAQIIQATILDHIDRGAEGASMGLILGSNAVITAVSPILAAIIVNAYGLGAVFYYNAGLIGASALVLLFTALRPVPVTVPRRVAAAG
jgi:MFS family permease